VIVLGLDISTSNVGLCVFKNDKLVLAEAISLSKIKCSFDKAEIVKKKLKELNKLQVDRILIEENLQSFRSGFSSAKTISSLAKFNGIVSYISQSVFSIKPEFVNVIRARSACGIKINRKSDLSTKEQVLEWVESSSQFLNYKWPTKVMASGPRKGMVVKTDQCYDIADAAVLCLFACN
jgi:hypothetical protein